MSQPSMWSQCSYAPNLSFTLRDPPDRFSADFPPSSSVHAQESDQQDDAPSWPATDPSQPAVVSELDADGSEAAVLFRHSGWRRTRDRVERALETSDVPLSRLRNFRLCGHRAYVLESIAEPGNYKITSSKCKDRFCKPCARERAGRVSRTLLDHVENKQLRFITLTLKTQTPNLTFELDRLYKAFQAIRRRAFWKRHVVGGCALLEVKHNESSDRWHPHLHILVEGSYIPHTKLATEWRAVTGDSFIVDVRAVKDNRRVTQYICKYATDPIDRSIGRSVDLLAQAIGAFRGRKTCLTFGSWRGVLLSEPDEKAGWRHIGSLNRLLRDLADGCDFARRIIATIWTYTETLEKNAPESKGRSPPLSDPDLFSP